MARAARFTPARLAVIVFAAIIAVVTMLLSLPVAAADNRHASMIDALFTATSAVCVTGLTTVDTATYWSPFGQAVIILGAAVGGLGIMTLASLLSFAVSRHVGLTQRMLAASENQSRLGDVAALLRAVMYTAIGAEALLALVLLPRFLTLGLDLRPAGTPSSWRCRSSTTPVSSSCRRAWRPTRRTGGWVCRSWWAPSWAPSASP